MKNKKRPRNKIYFMFTVFMLMNLSAAFSQIYQPVKWKYFAAKISSDTYRLLLKAVIEPGWHVYSQNQPAKSIAQALKLSFEKNMYAAFIGKPVETGKLIKA